MSSLDIATAMGSIHVEDDGAAHEPVAFLWPSLFTDHTMWDRQVPALRAAGWRTVAIDPPGHGRSFEPQRTFTMDDCADAVLAILDALQVDRPVVLMGTSWGGFVAPRVALRAPERVRGMVLFNTSAERAPLPGRLNATLLTWLLGVPVLDRTVDGMIANALLGPDSRIRDPALAPGLMRRFRSWNRAGAINTVRSVLVKRTAVLDRLGAIEAPTLIVSGAQDRILPTPLAQRIVGRLPKGRTVEVPGAAHLVPLEAPDKANRLMLDFLAALPA